MEVRHPHRLEGVAGVQAPAFVERSPIGALSLWNKDRVSPEFRLRPSLSVLHADATLECEASSVSPEFRLRPSLSASRGAMILGQAPSGGVAGVQAPAFVERLQIPVRRRSTADHLTRVSPEFRLRPSLSGDESGDGQGRTFRRVAGVQAPAFVERSLAAVFV